MKFFLYFIRYWFMISQFLMVSSQFAGSGIALWSDEEHESQPRNFEFVTIAIISCTFALIAAFATNKFQGSRITEELKEEQSKTPSTNDLEASNNPVQKENVMGENGVVSGELPSGIIEEDSVNSEGEEKKTEDPALSEIENLEENSVTPTSETLSLKNLLKNSKSPVVESAYLLLAALRQLGENVINAAGTKAWILQFTEKSSRVISPLAYYEFIAVTAYTLLIDIPFNFTNIDYEAAQAIRKMTGSNNNTLLDRLISKLLCCLPNNLGIWHTKTIGSLSHTFSDCLGMLLLLPPQVFFTTLEYSPWALALLILGTASIMGPLGLVNLAQTYLFEGKESEKKLKKLQQRLTHNLTHNAEPGERDPLAKIPHNAKESPNAKLSSLQKLSYQCLRVLILFTQSPLHAAASTMPVVLLLRHILKNKPRWLQATIISPIATLQFFGTLFGIQRSEVKESIKEIDKKLKKSKELENKSNSTVTASDTLVN